MLLWCDPMKRGWGNPAFGLMEFGVDLNSPIRHAHLHCQIALLSV